MPKAKPKADPYVSGLVASNPNMLVPHYLMACYAYYVEDNPVISDRLFDDITKQLIEKWDSIEHVHKGHITEDDLRAGTGFALKYPPQVPGALQSLRRMVA